MNTVLYQTILLYSKLILPWFLLGILLAFIAEKFIHPKILKKISGKFSLLEIVLVSIGGMVSPLSIMSFLPLAQELTGWGVPASILFSFFIAERSYDLQSFFIITGLFGLKLSLVVAFVILISLIVTICSLKKESIDFRKKGQKNKESFWYRNAKTLVVVIFGIILGAFLRTYIPEDSFVKIAGGEFGGIITALVIGFSVYLGPILGNYPVAKAFSDLGMSQPGVIAFLAISPILNFIIMVLFSSAVGIKKTLKATLVYSVTGIVLTILISAVI